MSAKYWKRIESRKKRRQHITTTLNNLIKEDGSDHNDFMYASQGGIVGMLALIQESLDDILQNDLKIDVEQEPAGE